MKLSFHKFLILILLSVFLFTSSNAVFACKQCPYTFLKNSPVENTLSPEINSQRGSNSSPCYCSYHRHGLSRLERLQRVTFDDIELPVISYRPVLKHNIEIYSGTFTPQTPPATSQTILSHRTVVLLNWFTARRSKRQRNIYPKLHLLFKQQPQIG